MNLHNVRKDLRDVLHESRLSQFEFAERHRLSYSWINKFLNGIADNPRLNSLNDLQAAIEKERALTKKKPVAPSNESSNAVA
jgi:transcriptional regulator with XRE-family HTH domain